MRNRIDNMNMHSRFFGLSSRNIFASASRIGTFYLCVSERAKLCEVKIARSVGKRRRGNTWISRARKIMMMPVALFVLDLT